MTPTGAFKLSDIVQTPPPAAQKTGSFTLADLDQAVQDQPDQENWFMHHLRGFGKVIEGMSPSKGWLDRLLGQDTVGALKEIPPTLNEAAKGQVESMRRTGIPVPFVAPSAEAAADALARGEWGEGSAHLLNAFLATKIGGADHPAISDIPQIIEDAKTAGTAVKGGAIGGAKAAIEPVNYGRYHIPIPAPIVGASAGGYAAGQFGLPRPLGAAIGGGAPIISGIFKGAREALAARRAQGLPDLAPATGEDAGLAALHEDLAQGQYKKSFASLAPGEEANVRTWAHRIENPDFSPDPSVSAVELPRHQRPLVDLGEDIVPREPRKSLSDMVDADLAARRAPAAQPAPIAPPNVPTWRQPSPGGVGSTGYPSSYGRGLGSEPAVHSALASNPQVSAAASAIAEKLIPGLGRGEVLTIPADPVAPIPRGAIPQARFNRARNADIAAPFLKENFAGADISGLPANSPVWDQLQALSDAGKLPGLNIPSSPAARLKLRDAIAERMEKLMPSAASETKPLSKESQQ